MDFAVLADLRERKTKDKYLDFARELKKLRNINVTVVPIVIGALGTVIEGLIRGLGNKRTSGDHPN